MIPATMKAAVLVGKDDVQVQNLAVPQPAAGEILVEVAAVAQNPTDWKHVDFSRPGTVGSVVGCDFAGTVKALGPGVSTVKLGDRVAGFVHGSYYVGRGAFAEYVVADAFLISIVPESIPFEEAAGLGVAAITTAQMLWQSLKLSGTPKSPIKEKVPLLVWSAASAVGQFVVQFAIGSGYTVIATASPKHHEPIKSLGAIAVFDYRDPEVSQKIRDFTEGKLQYAADCISEYDTPQLVAGSLGDFGGTVATLLPYDSVRPNVATVRSFAYSLFGKPCYGQPANRDHYEEGKIHCEWISEILASGTLKFPTPKILPNGLASVAEGLAFHKGGNVSGEKVTYRTADTP